MRENNASIWLASVFNLIRRPTRCDGTADSNKRKDSAFLWRIAWLLVSARLDSLPLFSSHASLERGIRALLGCRRFWDARRASFRYRTGCECGKIKLGEKLRRIGKAGALIYDRRSTPYAPAFRYIALPLHPWRLPIIERYCVTLPKALPGSRHVQRKIARLQPALTYSRIAYAILVAHASWNEQRLQTAKGDQRVPRLRDRNSCADTCLARRCESEFRERTIE